jgi:hypothetical protein
MTALALKEFIERIEVRYHKKKDGTVFPVDISASRFMMNGREVVLASWILRSMLTPLIRYN